MKLKMSGKMAFSAVLSNKLRSFLTMLGIIIGVIAVTVLVSLVQGATNSVTDQLDELGGNQIIVQITSTSRRMTLREVQALEEDDAIGYVSPTMSGSGTVLANGQSKDDISINGVTDRYTQVQGMDLEEGRGITRTDLDNYLSVTILGHDVAQDLFGQQSPLDQTVRINGKDYRVIGVLQEEADTMMGSTNDSVYIPYSNAQRLLSNVAVTSFYAVPSDGHTASEAVSALKDRLQAKFGDEDSYSVVNMNDIMDIVENVLGTLELLLGAIAGISLLVGGIGIMNIMLVSVTERTREIGIRKAIGAQRSDIIVQFLIEAIILSLTGGLIGLGISWGILEVINAVFTSYHFAVTATVAGVAVGFSIGVGVLFGIYPASKAASLKPINALRYE